MIQFEKLKTEINEMDVDTFIKHFITRKGDKDGAVKDYICGNIKHPQAHCTKNDDYSCLECLREFLKSEVK